MKVNLLGCALGWGGALLLAALPARAREAAAPAYRFDSLHLRLAAAPPGTRARAELLATAGWELMDVAPDSAERYLRLAVAAARRHRFFPLELRSLNRLGMVYLRRGAYPAARTALLAAVRRAIQTGDSSQLTLSYAYLNDVWFEQQEFRQGLRYARQALAVSRRFPTDRQYALMATMGALLALHQVDSAQPLMREALALARAQEPRAGVGQMFNVTAAWANGLRLSQPDSALPYAREALRLARRLGNVQAEGYAGMVLAQVQVARRQWADVLAVAAPALAQTHRYGNLDFEAELLAAYAVALRHLAPGSPAAYDSLRRAFLLRDTLFRQEQADALAAAQVKFDVAGHQDRIRVLEQQHRIQQLVGEQQAVRTRMLLAAALALATMLAGAAWFYLRLRRTSAALAASEALARAAEAQARQANHTKDELLSIIGHDLRSPVAAFQQVGALLAGYAAAPDPAELRALAAEVTQSATSLATLLDNLLHWARTQRGQLHSAPTTLAVAPLLADAVAPYRAAAHDKQLTLVVAATPPGLTVWADRQLLLTVLRNLTANAVKFTPAGGSLTVRATAAAAGAVAFAVADTGVGLEPAQLPGLFVAGPQHSTAGTAGEAGTGLGLPLCAQFVALLGGKLRATSGGRGAGATLAFELPPPPRRGAVAATVRKRAAG